MEICVFTVSMILSHYTVHGVRGNTYIVDSAITVLTIRLPITSKTVWPVPIDVLHCTTRFLEHDVAETCVVCAGSTICDGEITFCAVAIQEDGDVEDLAWVVF